MFKLTFLVLLATLSNVKCHIHLSNGSQTSLNHLACQIASSIDVHVTLVYLKNCDDGLLKCLSTSGLPLYTLSSDNATQTHGYLSIHILTIAEEPQKRLEHIGAMLDCSTSNKHLIKYMLIFRVPCEEFLIFTFRLFWTKQFLNVIALCSHNKTVQIYTYEPFNKVGLKVVQLPTTKDPFYDKLKNLNHYPLRVSMFYDPIRSIPNADYSDFRGIDGFLSKFITEHLNATMQIFVPPDGKHYGSEVHGKLSGALKEVATGRTHVGWNLRYIDAIHRRVIEPLYPIGKSFVLYLVVPKAGTVPMYTNFLRVFDSQAWLLLFLNFIIVAVLFAVMQQKALKYAHRYIKMRFGGICEMLFQTAIGNPIEKLLRISSLRELVISWIIFSYIIRTIYFAKMQSIFINPEYEKDIQDLDELRRLKVPIYSHSNYLNVIRPVLDPDIFRSIIEKSVILPEVFEANIRRITQTSNSNAFILRRERAKALVAKTVDTETKRPRYHMVKEVLILMPETYIVTKGSPFLEKFETLVIRCYEYGLMKHWDVISKAEAVIQANDKVDLSMYRKAGEDGDVLSDDAKITVVLTLEILQGAFYLWVIGIGVACFGFIVELGYFKFTGQRESSWEGLKWL